MENRLSDGVTGLVWGMEGKKCEDVRWEKEMDLRFPSCLRWPMWCPRQLSLPMYVSGGWWVEGVRGLAQAVWKEGDGAKSKEKLCFLIVSDDLCSILDRWMCRLRRVIASLSHCYNLEFWCWASFSILCVKIVIFTKRICAQNPTYWKKTLTISPYTSLELSLFLPFYVSSFLLFSK